MVCAGGVSFIALLLYARTLAPTVTFVDSGELIVAARSAGVPHPPGFPLWVMLAHVASLVPLGNVAVRVNFASAVFAALACGVFTLVATELMIRAADRSKATSGLFTILLPAVTVGLLLAFSRTLWSYATVTEVYTLNSLLIAIVLFSILRWRGMKELQRPAAAQPDSWLYGAAFVFGLALGVHHVTVALLLPGLALLVYKTVGLNFFTSRKVGLAALSAVTGLVAVYAYLPVAAARGPLLNWGDPRSLMQIWWHITGRQYQGFVSITPQAMAEQLSGIARMALREFGPAWLPMALIVAVAGFRYLWQRDRSTFWFLVLLLCGNLAYAACYGIAEDKDAYLLPSFMVMAMAVAFGVRWLLEFQGDTVRFSGALAALLLPAIALAGNWPFNDRSRYFVAHDYVENILGTIEPGGLLLTLDWQVASPMLYSREIEGRRRDVKVVDIHLLRRSWYFDYLRRAHPQLFIRSQREIDTFLAELRQWERDPGAYRESAARTERIAVAFREMCRALVTNEAGVAPVYVTSDVVFMTAGDNEEFSEWLATNYQLTVRGLILQLSQDSDLNDPGELHLQTRGLVDGTLRFEADDVVKVKVLSVYTRMLVNRGRSFALLREYERAAVAYEQALALDPMLEVARQGLRESKNALRSGNERDRPAGR